MILTKLSDKGWEKEFTSEEDLKQELFNWICNSCLKEENLTKDSSIDDLLCTACGLQFMVE